MSFETGDIVCVRSTNAGVFVGLMTDSRAAFLGGRLNPMLSEALDVVLSDRPALLAALARLARLASAGDSG